jgi:hypothetical protein
MPAISLHGVTIAWSTAGLTRDPLAELFAALDPVAFALDGSRTVRIEVRPAPPGAAADPRAEGWEPSFFHGVVDAYRGAGGFLIWDRASRVRVPPDGAPLEAEIAAADHEIVPGSTGTVLQIALMLALRRAGLFHLHAAALVLRSGVPVLVVGGSGAGKTTTTLALLEAGAAYLGDDALYVTAGGSPGDDGGRAPKPPGGVDVIAFPREFHLGPATLATFPRLAPLAGPPAGHGDKRPLDPARAYPGRLRLFFSLPAPGALALFPSVTAAEGTALVPLARADAFGHLLASSGALVVPGIAGRDENLAVLAALLRAVQCHALCLGADALAAPTAVADRIAGLPPPA